MRRPSFFASVGILSLSALAVEVAACKEPPQVEPSGGSGATGGTGGSGAGSGFTTSDVFTGPDTTGETGGAGGSGATGGHGGVPDFDLASLCTGGVGGGGSGGGAGGGNAGSGGGADCSMYPAEGYGNSIGSVLPPSFSFPGYAEQSGVVSTLSLEDYFDCDGSKGINALYIIESATWCGPCQMDAEQIGELLKGPWKDLGIHVMTLMVQDADINAATTDTALNWRNAFDLQSEAVGIDPDSVLYRHFCPDGIIFFPFGLVIDPRTMRIVAVHASGELGVVEALAQRNKLP